MSTFPKPNCALVTLCGLSSARICELNASDDTSSSFPAEGGLGPNAGGNEEPEVSDPNHSG